jgi:hypothetical protein
MVGTSRTRLGSCRASWASGDARRKLRMPAAGRAAASARCRKRAPREAVRGQGHGAGRGFDWLGHTRLLCCHIYTLRGLGEETRRK